MLHPTGLNTFGMTNKINRDLLYRGNGGRRGNLSIERVEQLGDQVAKHVYGLSTCKHLSNRIDTEFHPFSRSVMEALLTT